MMRAGHVSVGDCGLPADAAPGLAAAAPALRAAAAWPVITHDETNGLR